jgi:hypothetical protein
LPQCHLAVTRKNGAVPVPHGEDGRRMNHPPRLAVAPKHCQEMGPRVAALEDR